MSNQIAVDSFKSELFDLLEETFERVRGFYLDRGTSLFETLDTISDDIGASLAILAHTAYHLGEIRQALCTVR